MFITKKIKTSSNVSSSFEKIITWVLIIAFIAFIAYAMRMSYNYNPQYSYVIIKMNNESSQNSKTLKEIYVILHKTIEKKKLNDYIALEKAENQIFITPKYRNFSQFIPISYELTNSALDQLRKDTKVQDQIYVYMYENPLY